jgi:hypothetical protein
MPSTWLVVNTMMRSSPQNDHRPSVKLRSPDSVTFPRWLLVRAGVVVRVGGGVVGGGVELASLLRPLAVAGQVEGAVDVLDDDERAVGDLDEERAEVGVGGDAGESEVEHVISKVIRHGRDERRLARPGRTVQEVPALPRPPRPAVKHPPVRERREVGEEARPERGVQRQSVEGRRVAERHRRPRRGAAGRRRVRVQPPRARRALQVVRSGGEVRQVRREQSRGVALRQAQRGGLTLLQRVLERVGVVRPRGAVAVEGVRDRVVRRQRHGRRRCRRTRQRSAGATA